MIPSSFCFSWVNGAVASVYTIHEPFGHCLLQLGFWNILLVCPLFPFNSTLILQNLLKRLWLNPFLICASVLKSSGFTCHQTWLGTLSYMAGSGWFPSLRWIKMGDCQAARPIQRKVTTHFLSLTFMNYVRISRPVMGLIVDALTCSKISKYKHIYICIMNKHILKNIKQHNSHFV